MRLVKMLGLAAIAALASMALVGASSASAETTTSLCATHTSLSCASPLSLVNLSLLGGTGVGKLLTSLVNVLCLGVNVHVETEATTLASPLPLEVEVAYSGCGTTSTHNNCTVEEVNGPALFLLLKTGLDEGVAEAMSGEAHVHCTKIGGFIEIDCTYDASEIEFAAGALHLTANETVVTKTSGGSLCPSTSKLDGLVGGSAMILQ